MIQKVNCSKVVKTVDNNAKRKKNKIAEKKSEAENEGGFFCTQCHHSKSIEERALNLNGTLSILCLQCKRTERERSSNIIHTSKQLVDKFKN